MNMCVSFLLLFAVVIVVTTVVLHARRSDFILQDWATKNGYRIVSKEYRNVLRGPFFGTTGNGQTVYRVVVQDQDSNTRTGWVRFGSFWLGILSDHVDVHWDE